MSRKFHQGKYKVRNPEKYLGDATRCIYRSSWEKRLMIALDHSSKVMRWGSEEVVVQYISPLDGKPHRYFTDFVVIAKDPKGNLITTLIEVKPEKEKYPPSNKGKSKERYLREMATYAVNQAKWKAAETLCEKRGWRWVVATEHEILGSMGK